MRVVNRWNIATSTILVVLALVSRASAYGGSYVYTTFDPPGTSQSAAFGINNAGAIVGGYIDQSGVHGYLYNGGTFTTLDAPGR